MTHDERLVGIITADDIIDIIDQEATEDMQKMAAVVPLDDEYLKSGVFNLASKRLVWLFVLMISATLTSFILNSFEATLAIIPTLTIFIPMLLNTAGNSGGQSSTLIVRALAIGEIHTYDYFQIIKKEMGVALIAGAALAAFNFIWILIQIQIGFINISSGAEGWLIALLVSLTLFTTIFIAKSIGASLPIIAKKVGLDPALMAGPLVSTIVDSVSLMVYFLLATQLFSLI